MASAGGRNVAWRLVCDQAAASISVLDLDGRFRYVNQALCNLLGYDREEILHRHRHDFVHPDDLPGMDLVRDVLASSTDKASLRVRCVRSDGRVVRLMLSASLIRDERGDPLYIVTHAQDITAWYESTVRWQRTFAHAPIGMALLDTSGAWTEVNASLCELLGYEHDELLARHPSHLAYPDEPGEALAEVFRGHKDRASLEIRYRHKGGYPVWLLVRVSAVPGPDGKPVSVIGQYEEIGDRRMSDEHLAHLALHDALTGLANRALLFDRLDHALAELHRGDDVLAALLVDLDDLKRTNDQHGHAAGDQLLLSVADELLASSHADDTVARIGGDEFVVVSRFKDQPTAAAFREIVEQRLRADISVAGLRLCRSASVGLATATSGATSRTDLLRNADRDMYARKRRQRR